MTAPQPGDFAVVTAGGIPDAHGVSYAYVHGGQVARTVELGEDFHIDLDSDRRIVGVEVLRAGVDWRDALVLMAMSGRIRVQP